MLVLLNLTAPPILLLFLPAAFVGNYALPAPPLSDVAVFSPTGEPLPAWVLNSTLYVLQDGDPAVAVYVPKFENASGLYSVAVNAPSLVVQAPPGVMVEDVSPTPSRVEVNKTGLYLYLQGPASVKYTFFSVEVRPPPQRTATPPTTAPPVTTPTQTTTQPTQPTQTATTAPPPPATQPTVAPAAPPPSAPGGGGAELMWAAAGVLVAAAAAAALLLRRRSAGGGCADLNETDLAIIRALGQRGGAADRVELQDALSIPKTTLHRHLHKLARYGYVRLVQEGARQRVELLKSC